MCTNVYMCMCVVSSDEKAYTALLAATICCRASLVGETSRTPGCVQEGMRVLTFFPWILARPMRSLPVSRSACGFPSVGSSTDCAPSAHAHTHTCTHMHDCQGLAPARWQQHARSHTSPHARPNRSGGAGLPLAISKSSISCLCNIFRVPVMPPWLASHIFPIGVLRRKSSSEKNMAC